ncbi:MAG: hypothetical protein WCI72_05810 [archaeon]
MVINRVGGGIFRSSLKKKGSSHLEIIISFILFVSFTLFLVLTLEPTKQNLLEDSILFGVKNAFFDSSTTNVTSVLVDAKNALGVCVTDVPCFPNELNLGINKNNISSVPPKPCAYYILTSTEFLTNSVTVKCSDDPNRNNYSLGYIEKQQVLSNNTLEGIKVQYYADYNASKFRFGVPAVVDFAVISPNGFDTYSLERTIPDDAEVVSGVYRKRVLYGNGSIINQDFIVKVW